MVTATKSIRNTGVIYSVSGSGVEVGKSLVSGSGLISGSTINGFDITAYNRININNPSSTTAKLNISSGTNSNTTAIYVENNAISAVAGNMMVMNYTVDNSLAGTGGSFTFSSGPSFIQFEDGDTILAKIKAISSTQAALVTSSDYRLKSNVENYSGSLDIIKRLQPKKFIWKSSNEKDVGFIAHEIKEIVPEGIIFGDKDGDEYQMIRYDGFIVYLVGAIKEQQQLIEDLRKDLNELKSK